MTVYGWFSASEMTYIVSGGALNSTHSLTMVDFTPYKCISNKYENKVSESSEYIFIRLWRTVT